MIFPEMATGTLMGEFSTEEKASDAQSDYTVDLIMNGFMMSMDDVNVYEKEYDDYTLQVETVVKGTDFTLYLTIA